jgi:hypothetical protein
MLAMVAEGFGAWHRDLSQPWQLAQRSSALPSGLRAFVLGTSSAILTETLPAPKLLLPGPPIPSPYDAHMNLESSGQSFMKGKLIHSSINLPMF